jgi:hypothetical protein
MKISPRWLKQNIFKKSKMPRKKSEQPPSPSPSQGCALGGVVVALFSHKQWLLLWL